MKLPILSVGLTLSLLTALPAVAGTKKCGTLGSISGDLDGSVLPALVVEYIGDSGKPEQLRTEIIPLNEDTDKALSSRTAGSEVCLHGRPATSTMRKFFAFSID